MRGIATKVVRQHLIDPYSCIRCGNCEMACPRQAISMLGDNFVIDADRCDNSGQCLTQCDTGAIKQWRLIGRGAEYTLEDQSEWTEIPSQIGGVDSDPDFVADMPTAGDVPPPSAPIPLVNAFSARAPAIGTVVVNRRLTSGEVLSDIRHVVIDIADASFRVLEGQSVGIVVPGVDEAGHPHRVRLYSVASPRDGEGREPAHVAFTVKRVTTDRNGSSSLGLCSNYLCNLEPGERVQLVGPYGSSFLMPDDPQTRMLMICTGTGIAPMRGMIERRRLTGAADPSALMLFFGGRTLGDLPYIDELRCLAGSAINLDLAFSRAVDHPRRYVQDLLLERREHLAAVLSDPATYIYLCGLRGMEEGVLAAFEQICHNAGLVWADLSAQMRGTGRIHIETY